MALDSLLVTDQVALVGIPIDWLLKRPSALAAGMVETDAIVDRT